MSGGHFNGNGYVYYQVSQFADELFNEIENNESDEESGCDKGFSRETLSALRLYVESIKKISDIMRHIDYLYSGDYSEETFLNKVKDTHQSCLDSVYEST